MVSVKNLERNCVGVYLKYILGIDGEVFSRTIHMTEDEYQEDKRQREENRKKREAEKYAERKRKEFYICPWKDGDVFYLPFRREDEKSPQLLKSGYTGMILVKVESFEDYVTTNIWPLVIVQWIRNEYTGVERMLSDRVFDRKKEYKKWIMMHKKHQKIPDELKLIGNISDLSQFNIVEDSKSAIKWNQIGWYLVEVLKIIQ